MTSRSSMSIERLLSAIVTDSVAAIGPFSLQCGLRRIVPEKRAVRCSELFPPTALMTERSILHDAAGHPGATRLSLTWGPWPMTLQSMQLCSAQASQRRGNAQKPGSPLQGLVLSAPTSLGLGASRQSRRGQAPVLVPPTGSTAPGKRKKRLHPPAAARPPHRARSFPPMPVSSSRYIHSNKSFLTTAQHRPIASLLLLAISHTPAGTRLWTPANIPTTAPELTRTTHPRALYRPTARDFYPSTITRQQTSFTSVACG